MLRFGFLASVFVLSSLVWAETPALKPPAGITPEAIAGQDQIKLGPMTINKPTRTVRMEVELALTEGILEYLLVGRKGKTYESVFLVDDLKASELSFALLLIGAEPANFNELLRAREAGIDPEAFAEEQAGHLIAIRIFREGREYPMSAFIRDREGLGTAQYWLFTGGAWTASGDFVSDSYHSLIAYWLDDVAIINAFTLHRNPYRGEFGFELDAQNPALVVGQKYELVFSVLGQEAPEPPPAAPEPIDPLASLSEEERYLTEEGAAAAAALQAEETSATETDSTEEE